MTMFRTVLLIVVCLLPNFVLAQTFNVATSSQLRGAFDNASVNGEDDTIILEAGTYKTTADGVGTFKFSDTEAHNLTIKAKDGLTANDVILDGANTHQVLNLTNTQTATFTLDRVTVRNGKNSLSSAVGGGIYTNKNLTVTDSTIAGNASSWHCGGISGSIVTVTNSTISGNTASYSSVGDGGGICGSTVTVTNSTISGNTAGFSGGGIYGTTVTVTKSTISGNTTSDGGGIHGAKVTVINSAISGNTASSSGGGIYNACCSTVTVINSTISGNTAGYSGGGIDGSTVTVTNSTISGNTASSSGGGIRGNGTFINNIFNNNSSDIYFTDNSNVYNNYIDYTKLQNEGSKIIVKKNNIQPSSGSSLNFADSSFRLGDGSVAIGNGLDPNSTTFTNLFTGNTTTLQTVQTALQTDKDGNTRIIGSAIDLGAYEYVTSTFTLSTTNQAFTSTSGTANITVTGSGSWTASSTLSWVTITSGASGTGSGTVTISVSANTTGATRTGNITIAGQTVVITQSDSVFSDVASTYGFYSYINAIYNAAITLGCAQNPLRYCSDDVVTRGAMAAFIIRAVYGENSTYTLTPYFSDVPATHGFFKYVQKMKDAGITGVTGSYDVNGTVTRGAMAAFIIRAKYGENFTYTLTPYYSDVPATHGFFKYVQKMKDSGITAVTGTYNVNDTVTRGAMAAFIARAFLGMQ